MGYKIELTNEAEYDLNIIEYYIASNDSFKKAVNFIDSIEDKISTLTVYPQRGTLPKEFKHEAINNCHEIFYKTYRIIYKIQKKTVYIVMITDGRRKLDEILRSRILNFN